MKKVYWILMVLGMLCVGISLPQSVSAAVVIDSASDDNTTATANWMTIGDTVQGVISETDDLDYYTFTLESAGCVTLKMTSYMRYYCIKVFNQDGDEIWYTDYNEWTETVGYRRDEYKLYLERGTYYMEINGYRNETYAKSTGKYIVDTDFASSNTTFNGDGNSFADANDISAGSTIIGQISEGEDHDTFKFSLSETGCVSLKMTSYMQYYCIKVFNLDGEEIWDTDYNEWTETVGYRRDEYKLYLEQGTYYMEINGYRYAQYYKTVGKYIVDTGFVSSNTTFHGDDNSFADANSISSTKTYIGQISINDDFDTYQFRVSSGGKIPFTITSYMQYYCIKLFNADGEEIWYTDYNEWNGNVGYRKDTHYAVLNPGIYYIQINGYKYGTSSKSTGKYKFSMSTGAVKKLDRVNNLRTGQQKKALNLYWDAVSDAEGYQICYSTSKTFKSKKTVATTSTSTTLRGLKAKKKYYVKVRAYVVVGGKKIYGKYSAVVKQKTL